MFRQNVCVWDEKNSIEHIVYSPNSPSYFFTKHLVEVDYVTFSLSVFKNPRAKVQTNRH